MKKEILLIMVFFGIGAGISAQSWTALNAGLLKTAVNVEKISIVDKDVVWCVSGSTSPTHEFAVSTDGGVTFKKGTVKGMGTKQYFSDIFAISDKVAYVSVYSNPAAPGAVYKTTDGGATWTQQAPSTLFFDFNSFPNALHFWDENNGLAFGDPTSNNDDSNEIFTTNDGGTTWTQVPAANVPANTLPENGTYYNYNPLVVKDSTVWYPTVNGYLYRSDNKGQNWRRTKIDTTATIASLSFLDDKLTGIAVTNQAVPYKTIDGGETWTQMSGSANGPFPEIVSVPGTGIFVTSTASGAVRSAYSIDKGETWIKIDDVNQYYGLEFKDMNTGYAGGNPKTTGGLYKWNPGILDIKEETKLNKCQLYPNPVSGKLIIDLSRTELSSASIMLSNVQGQILKSINCTNNFSEMEINEPDGMYFITVRSANESFTTRVVVKK